MQLGEIAHGLREQVQEDQELLEWVLAERLGLGNEIEEEHLVFFEVTKNEVAREIVLTVEMVENPPFVICASSRICSIEVPAKPFCRTSRSAIFNISLRVRSPLAPMLLPFS